LRGRARMHAQLVHDSDVTGHHTVQGSRFTVQGSGFRVLVLSNREPGTLNVEPQVPVFSPRKRSDATQIAFLPSSRNWRATASRSCDWGAASLISIGRFTPVTTSMRSFSRKVMPRFDGVPPNMSVSTST